MSSSNGPSVTAHALSSGSITLPSNLFVHPADDTERVTVPSLSFLIQHRTSHDARPTRLVFDLGIRRITDDYPAPLVKHLKTREPLTSRPDVSERLAEGGLQTDDIDFVALSHVHWDHVGTPSDFKRSTFIVGHGSLALLEGGGDGASGGHGNFEKGLLSLDRTIELPPATATSTGGLSTPSLNPDGHHYEQLEFLPHVIDLFGTGLVYLVDAPGHLQGHQNLLVRTSESTWLYLAGDAAHDRRLFRGTHSIGTWINAHGNKCSIHYDDRLVQETLQKIRRLEKEGLAGCKVEVIFAHDVEWLEEENNRKRFWPGQL